MHSVSLYMPHGRAHRYTLDNATGTGEHRSNPNEKQGSTHMQSRHEHKVKPEFWNWVQHKAANEDYRSQYQSCQKYGYNIKMVKAKLQTSSNQNGSSDKVRATKSSQWEDYKTTSLDQPEWRTWMSKAIHKWTVQTIVMITQENVQTTNITVTCTTKWNRSSIYRYAVTKWIKTNTKWSSASIWNGNSVIYATWTDEHQCRQVGIQTWNGEHHCKCNR